jgi:hypothetical protein
VVRAIVEPNATLHDALEEMLMSNAGTGRRRRRQGSCQGILDIERLADVLKRMRSEAKKHYEQLAVQEAELTASGGSNRSEAGHR